MTCCCNHSDKKPCCSLVNGSQFKDAKPSVSIALAGNPNCGKTTLFNVLTGTKQRVGNWPGVTVECKRGWFVAGDRVVEVIDLPGIYSLIQMGEAAIDECIASEFILNQQANVIVNIVDASALSRHLYLTVQLLEMGLPVILALNMMDAARAKDMHINIEALSQALGCPVVALEANKAVGIAALKQAIVHYQPSKTSALTLPYPAIVSQAINALSQTHTQATAIRLLEGNHFADAQAVHQANDWQHTIRQTLNEDVDIVLADTRYQFIQQLLQMCMSNTASTKTTWTQRIDNIVLNRVLGIPVFLAVMYLMFVFTINVGGVLQTYFNQASQAVFVDGIAYLLQQYHAPSWLVALLANGLGKGVNTTITFIPVIGALFLFLAVLEDSGYMARAAFVVDRFMRMLGLPGKAFVPMIVGFGCNVPAVLAARTLDNKRDRIITVMMSPFMSCGARLTIYAVFAAAFFPSGGQNVVFSLYLIGIFIAILTGFILRQTTLPGSPAPLLMELPPYRIPQLKSLCLHAWQRLKSFVFRAGQLIVPICMIIGALNSLNVDGTLNAGDGSTHSLLSVMGQSVTPIFAPMGIHADNWPATVGLLTGVLAKEVVVGTLNTLYAQMGTLGVMVSRFDGQIGAFAYLLFILLYFPCVSTLGAMLRELPRRWAFFSASWTTSIAYSAAVMFYQGATWMQHPAASFTWIFSLSALLVSVVMLMRWYASQDGRAELLTAAPAREVA